MKKALYILLLMLVATASCRNVKKSTHTDNSVVDSSKTESAQTVIKTNKLQSITELGDTLIGIKARSVFGGFLKPLDFSPATLPNGQKIGRRHETKKDGLTAYVNVDSNGRISYGCDADSFAIIVQNLQREKVYLLNQFDSVSALYESSMHREQSTSETHTIKTKSLFQILLPYALVILVIAVLYRAGKWLYKKYK